MTSFGLYSNIQRVHFISKAVTVMGIGDETGPGPRRVRGGVCPGERTVHSLTSHSFVEHLGVVVGDQPGNFKA